MSNTWQYMTGMDGFLQRVAHAQRTSNVVQFRLGAQKVYMVSGERNIQTINQPSHAISPEVFFLQVMAHAWGASRQELVKFEQDKSGRRRIPTPGREVKPGQPCLWHGQHQVYSEYLQRADRANFLAAKYQQPFSERLAKQPLGEWTQVSLKHFFETEMAEAALVALMGPRIIELNPGFWPAMWEFIQAEPRLMWGLPWWLNAWPWKARARFRAMCRKYVEAAAKTFDLTGPDADAEWEPHYGSRVARELVQWARQHLSVETMAGLVATFIFGTNSNSVPLPTWAMMELIADPELYQAVREECLIASVADPITDQRTFDLQKLLSMPLLQSVYTETLRLHVSINVTREVTQPIRLDGYLLTAGSLVQAPSQIGQYNEAGWGVEGHPASTFWARRHLKEEILMTLALLVTRFDIELIGWTHLDGAKSRRRAENDRSCIGAVGIPPDRDLKVRWKRLW
ncbi:cytochrome P450 [Aspergillus falconensis]